MKICRHFTVIFLIIVMFSAIVSARSKRVNQIPNGSKYSCNNCHNGQGGSRNLFGQQIGSGYLTTPGLAGNVVWGPALAALDADGDGGSNGTELLDPGGTWKIGDAAPGDASLVSNPGNPASVSMIRNPLVSLPGSFDLKQNYPNPFNPTTTIVFDVAETGHVGLYIYNINGQLVRTLIDESMTPGQYVAEWNGLDRLNRQLTSGIYYYRLVTGSFSKTKTMTLLK